MRHPSRRRWSMALVLGLAALLGVVAGTFSPAQAATPVATVDDATTSGTNKFAFSGTWVTCTGCNTGAYQNSFKYSATTGSALTFTFVGGQAVLHGFKEPQGGIATVSVDGGPAVVLADSAASMEYAPTWLSDGTILYVNELLFGLRRVPAAGGPVEDALVDSTLYGFGIVNMVPLPRARGALFLSLIHI